MTDLLNIRAWAMKEDVFLRLAPLVEQRIQEGKSLDLFRIRGEMDERIISSPPIRNEERAKAVEGGFVEYMGVNGKYKIMYDYQLGFPYYEDDEGTRIAKISNLGTMLKYGYCGGGMKAIIQQLNNAYNSKSIKGIVLVTDSPGGEVDGTPEFAEAVRNANKPVVAFVDGLCASAAVWVASQASHIMLNRQNYSEMGSIGVLCTLVDQTGWLAKEGLKVKIMRAKQSTDKALLNPYEEWPPEQIDKLQSELDDIADDFKSMVILGRGSRLKITQKNLFSGQMYNMAECLEYGLADSAGTMTDAIAKAKLN